VTIPSLFSFVHLPSNGLLQFDLDDYLSRIFIIYALKGNGQDDDKK
jgi:hypothetical protein